MMSMDEIAKALGSLFAAGGLGWWALRVFRRTNSSDSVALREDAGRTSLLDYHSRRIEKLEADNDALRKEAAEAGRFSAKAELLSEHVAKLEKTMLEATAQMVTLRAELDDLQEALAERDSRLAERDAEVARLSQKLIDHGISPK